MLRLIPPQARAGLPFINLGFVAIVWAEAAYRGGLNRNASSREEIRSSHRAGVVSGIGGGLARGAGESERAGGHGASWSPPGIPGLAEGDTDDWG